MKKLILIILAIYGVQTTYGQSFTLNPRVAKGQDKSSKFTIEVISTITNNINDTNFAWEILDINMPSAWQFSMCDPFNCLSNLSPGSKSNFSLATTKNGDFKGDFSPNGVGGTATVKVKVYYKNNPSVFDTLTYQVLAWATGVKEVSQSKEFSFYPNPAKDVLVIRYQTKEPVTVTIYNILGTKVRTLVHSGSETEINLSDLQNGIYFIGLKDGNHNISKTFTKSE